MLLVVDFTTFVLPPSLSLSFPHPSHSTNILNTKKKQRTFNPPKIPGKDDITGEPLTQRPDDTAVRSSLLSLPFPFLPSLPFSH